MSDNSYTTDCLCLQTRRADRILTQLYDSFIKKSGLKSTQYCLLRCISNLQEPCFSDVGCALAMDQTTVSRNMNVLKKKGLILTNPSPIDPRRTNVKITPAGEEALKVGELAWMEAQNQVKKKLGEETFHELYKMLGRLSEIIT